MFDIPSNWNVLNQNRIVLEKLDIVLYGLLNMREGEKVNRVNLRSLGRELLLELAMEYVVCECDHAAARVVEHHDFACAEELLGDDNRPKSLATLILASTSLASPRDW
jgi:hypothetical protein